MRALLQSLKSRSLRFGDPVEAEVPQVRDAELAAIYYGQRIGGDLCDFIRVSPQRVLFGLLDVAGRVEENHEIVSAAKATFRAAGTELLAQEDINETDAMIEISLQLNRAIIKAADGVRSCPAFAGCYNEGLGTVCYFNAGHTAGLAAGSSGITELHATGLPLGLFSHSPSDAGVVALEPGSVLLLVSRGVVEGKRKSEEFGLDRVKQGFEQRRSESARKICLSALDDVKQFSGGARMRNDLTALVLARAG
jgi:serine phosphatase RsbU (regulator of sigma subunit)